MFLHNMIFLLFCHNLNIGFTIKVKGTNRGCRSKTVLGFMHIVMDEITKFDFTMS
jgi:hypothetical protein